MKYNSLEFKLLYLNNFVSVFYLPCLKSKETNNFLETETFELLCE